MNNRRREEQVLGALVGIFQNSKGQMDRKDQGHVDHLSLRNFSAGVIDKDDLGPINRHLRSCDSCFQLLMESDNSHLATLRSQAETPIDFPLNELITSAESNSSFPDALQTVLACRSFEVFVYCYRDGVFLSFEADDLSDLTHLQVADSASDRLLINRPRYVANAKILEEFRLGDTSELAGHHVCVSFRFQGSLWVKNIIL